MAGLPQGWGERELANGEMVKKLDTFHYLSFFFSSFHFRCISLLLEDFSELYHPSTSAPLIPTRLWFVTLPTKLGSHMVILVVEI